MTPHSIDGVRCDAGDGPEISATILFNVAAVPVQLPAPDVSKTKKLPFTDAKQVTRPKANSTGFSALHDAMIWFRYLASLAHLPPAR